MSKIFVELQLQQGVGMAYANALWSSETGIIGEPLSHRPGFDELIRKCAGAQGRIAKLVDDIEFVHAPVGILSGKVGFDYEVGHRSPFVISWRTYRSK